MMMDAAPLLVFSGRDFVFRAFSAPEIHGLHPGALPQAITFRALGAESRSFDTALNAPDTDQTRDFGRWTLDCEWSG
jgi:hypothetical protein